MIPEEDSHSGRVRASRTRVDESLEGSNPSSSASRCKKENLFAVIARLSIFGITRGQ